MSNNKEYYELHVTMVSSSIPYELSDLPHKVLGPKTWSEYIKWRVETLHWTYSRIDGDPVEGPGVKHYATMQLNTRVPLDDVQYKLLTAVNDLQEKGVNCTRWKIEKVIFDSSSSKVRV